MPVFLVNTMMHIRLVRLVIVVLTIPAALLTDSTATAQLDAVDQLQAPAARLVAPFSLAPPKHQPSNQFDPEANFFVPVSTRSSSQPPGESGELEIPSEVIREEPLQIKDLPEFAPTQPPSDSNDFEIAPPAPKFDAPDPSVVTSLPEWPSEPDSAEHNFFVPKIPLLNSDFAADDSALPEEVEQQDATNNDSPNWWVPLVQRPLHPGNSTLPVDSNSLVFSLLANSPRIQAISRDPLIREFEVIEADAAFDPVAFLNTKWDDRSDPVGGQLDLTVDNSDTIENNIWSANGGLRRKLRNGGNYELNQRLGFENSNLRVFNPNDQGTAQLSLNVTQPLARGRGRYVAESQILIAQTAGGVAWETFQTELQSEIENIVSAYWRLYYDRSVYLQKRRNVQRGEEILALLEARQDLDSLPSQITRARSSIQSRKTDLANAFRDVRNSETELRRATADRNWLANQTIELLPQEIPIDAQIELPLDQVVFTALNNRPEIRESIQRAKIAGIQKDLGVNDLLPELSLLLGTYVSALQDENRIDQAFFDQFGSVTPGYSVGFEFEMPMRNRIARSRLVQRKLQLAKIRNQVDATIQDVIAESQVAIRRLESAAETLIAANQSIAAARADLQQQTHRWESFALVEGDFADGQTPTTVLDQLLDSQERLASAEAVAAKAQMELKISEVALQRTMGTLLIQRSISYQRSFDTDTPRVEFQTGIDEPDCQCD